MRYQLALAWPAINMLTTQSIAFKIVVTKFNILCKNSCAENLFLSLFPNSWTLFFNIFVTFCTNNDYLLLLWTYGFPLVWQKLLLWHRNKRSIEVNTAYATWVRVSLHDYGNDPTWIPVPRSVPQQPRKKREKTALSWFTKKLKTQSTLQAYYPHNTN